MDMKKNIAILFIICSTLSTFALNATAQDDEKIDQGAALYKERVRPEVGFYSMPSLLCHNPDDYKSYHDHYRYKSKVMLAKNRNEILASWNQGEKSEEQMALYKSLPFITYIGRDQDNALNLIMQGERTVEYETYTPYVEGGIVKGMIVLHDSSGTWNTEFDSASGLIRIWTDLATNERKIYLVSCSYSVAYVYESYGMTTQSTLTPVKIAQEVSGQNQPAVLYDDHNGNQVLYSSLIKGSRRTDVLPQGLEFAQMHGRLYITEPGAYSTDYFAIDHLGQVDFISETNVNKAPNYTDFFASNDYSYFGSTRMTKKGEIKWFLSIPLSWRYLHYENENIPTKRELKAATGGN